MQKKDRRQLLTGTLMSIGFGLLAVAIALAVVLTRPDSEGSSTQQGAEQGQATLEPTYQTDVELTRQITK